MPIIDRDNGFKGLVARMKFGAPGVSVGVDSRPHEPTGIPTDEIAMAHEFGIGVPERSFLRAWVEENENVVFAKLRDLAWHALIGDITYTEAQQRFGEFCVNSIRSRIIRGIDPPLLPETINRKETGRFATIPLINTGQMHDAIIYQIDRKED